MPVVTRLLTRLCLAVVIAGCTMDAGREAPDAEIDIGSGIRFQLPVPTGLDQPVSAIQSVTVAHGGSWWQFEARLRGTAEAFLLVGLDAFGRRAVTLRWTAGGVDVERASWFTDSIPTRNLLADIILIYWPERIVNSSLSRSEANFQQGASHRSVFKDGREVIRIDYVPDLNSRWSGTAGYRNIARDYSIDIRSAEVPE